VPRWPSLVVSKAIAGEVPSINAIATTLSNIVVSCPFLLHVASEYRREANERVPPGMWLELRGAISSDVNLSDCRLAFKQRSGREGRAFRKPAGEFFERGAISEYPLF
jgi:hypothetical protein